MCRNGSLSVLQATQLQCCSTRRNTAVLLQSTLDLAMHRSRGLCVESTHQKAKHHPTPTPHTAQQHATAAATLAHTCNLCTEQRSINNISSHFWRTTAVHGSRHLGMQYVVDAQMLSKTNLCRLLGRHEMANLLTASQQAEAGLQAMTSNTQAGQ